jgi:nitrite reductase/ring-hydroxylating ferredoxin subunit
MAAYVRVAKTSDIPMGAGICVEPQGTSVALFNINGQFYAIGNICTHRGGPLSEGFVEGETVACPWHGARFNISTGEVCGPPAPIGVPRYNVRVEGDEVEVEV